MRWCIRPVLGALALLGSMAAGFVPAWTEENAPPDMAVTLINVEAGGDGTVIFPNTFQQDNFLPANTEMKFLDADAPFQFRLKDPGTETVIAICNATGVGADGIEHDFKARQFTPLGNYRQFLTRRIVVEGAAKVAAGQKHKVSANNAPDGAETSGPEAADDASEDLARTAHQACRAMSFSG